MNKKENNNGWVFGILWFIGFAFTLGAHIAENPNLNNPNFFDVVMLFVLWPIILGYLIFK